MNHDERRGCRSRGRSAARLLRAALVAALGLSAATADAGEDPAAHPTDLGSLLELRDDYTDNGRSGFSNSTVIRGDWAAERWLGFRLEVPFVYAEAPGAPGRYGLGDVWLRSSVRLGASRVSAFMGADLIVDSAGSPLLGQGKNQIGPFVIGAYEIGKGAWVRLFVQEVVSFGGDPSRPDVRAEVVRPYAFVALPDGFWLVVDQKLQIDHHGPRKLAFTSVLELGKELSDDVGIYLDPGVQLASPPAVSWLLSAGARWLVR